jgi:hypothetical protein
MVTMTGGLDGKLVGPLLAAVHPHRVVFAQLEIEGQLEEDASYDVPGQGGKTNTKLECQFIVVWVVAVVI